MYLKQKEKNSLTLPHSAQSKHSSWGEIKQMSKTKKLASRKKIALEFLQQILGHISTRSLMAAGATNVWGYIELK